MVQVIISLFRHLAVKFKNCKGKDNLTREIVTLPFYEAALQRLHLLGLQKRLAVEILHMLNRGLQLYPQLGVTLLARVGLLIDLLTPAVLGASRDEARQGVHEVVVMLRFLMQREGQKELEENEELSQTICSYILPQLLLLYGHVSYDRTHLEIVKFVKDVAVVRQNALSQLPSKPTLIDIIKHAISGSDTALQESGLVLLKVVLDTKDPDLYLLAMREGLRKKVQQCSGQRKEGTASRSLSKENIAETILQKQLNNPTFQMEIEEEQFNTEHIEKRQLSSRISQLFKVGPALGSWKEFFILLLHKLQIDSLTAHQMDTLQFSEFLQSLIESEELASVLVEVLRSADSQNLYEGFNHFVRSLQILMEASAVEFNSTNHPLRMQMLLSSGCELIQRLTEPCRYTLLYSQSAASSDLALEDKLLQNVMQICKSITSIRGHAMYCVELEEIVQQEIREEILKQNEQQQLEMGGLSLLSPQSLSSSLKTKMKQLIRRGEEKKDIGDPGRYEVIVTSNGKRLKMEDTLAQIAEEHSLESLEFSIKPTIQKKEEVKEEEQDEKVSILLEDNLQKLVEREVQLAEFNETEQLELPNNFVPAFTIY